MENNVKNYRLVSFVEETNILPIGEVGRNGDTFLLSAEKNYAYDKNSNLREVKENKGVDYSSLFEMEERANTLFNHPDNNRMMNHYDDVIAPQRYTSGIRNLAKENRMQAREARIQNRYRNSQIETKPKEERIGYLNKPVSSNKSSYLNLSSSLNNQKEIVMKPKKKEKNYEEIANVFYPDMPEVSQIKARAKKTNLADFITDNAYSTFYRNYKDMKEANTKFADKYFHAKANCEAGQKMQIKEAIDISIGREIFDGFLNNPLIKKLSLKENVSDCLDDLKVDFDGLYLGIKNPNIDCKILVDKYRPKGLDEKY